MSMAMAQLEGRVALITGGGEGIGRGLAAAFLKEGAKVVIAEFNAPLGRRTAEQLAAETDGKNGSEIVYVPCDVTDKAQMQTAVAETINRFGTIDVLVNNAWSGGELSRVEHKTDELLSKAFAVGYYGPFWAMQAAFPTMKARGYGRIISLCSLNGVNAHIGTTEYNSAKEALRALTRTAAREWAPYGIVANIICPGAKSAAFERVVAKNPELVASADAANPMGRLGDPEHDIAPVAVFLASEGARYLTGNTLFVDGGSHINGAHWALELPE
jgi:NAD(P)-dependent dehydrogenase (short-subunit alcohol dehydrogenase family)